MMKFITLFRHPSESWDLVCLYFKEIPVFVGMTFALLFFSVAGAQAHCQMPCGIYNDARVFDELEEHVTTIEKSMKMILASDNMHDIARWTLNKEEHAQHIQDSVSAYFLTQRLKPNIDDYAVHLALLHQILIHAMKAKQTTELSHVEALKRDIDAYEKLYFAPHEHKAHKAHNE